MNKKILSIFVMVMALSLLGVSCNKKTTDPTNDGGSTTTKEVTLTQIQNAVRLLGNLTDSGNNGSVDFRNVTVGKDAAVAVDAKAGSTGLTADAVKGLIEGAKGNVKLANTTVTVTTSTISTGATTTFTIKFVANSGYSITGFNSGVVKDEAGKKAVTITVTMTGKDNAGSSSKDFS